MAGEMNNIAVLQKKAAMATQMIKKITKLTKMVLRPLDCSYEVKLAQMLTQVNSMCTHQITPI